MNREEFENEQYQQKMMEHRIRMEKRREKRKKEKRLHILLFFLLLLLLFLAFVGIRYALPYFGKREEYLLEKKLPKVRFLRIARW